MSEPASKEQMTILININKLERMMRKGRKDLRRMKKPYEKTKRKYELVVRSIQNKKQMLNMFEEQRDKLLIQLQPLGSSGGG